MPTIDGSYISSQNTTSLITQEQANEIKQILFTLPTDNKQISKKTNFITKVKQSCDDQKFTSKLEFPDCSVYYGTISKNFQMEGYGKLTMKVKQGTEGD